MTKDYDPGCIGGTMSGFTNGSYVLSQSGSLWHLSDTIIPLSYSGGYRDQFPIFLDANGLLSSTGNLAPCNISRTVDCRTIFTREIKLTQTAPDHMKVNSIVKWADNTKSGAPYIIDLEMIMTNWRKNL